MTVEDKAISLPFHRADKKVPHINDRGERIEPAEPNGVKFECFIFDALAEAANPVNMEVLRKEEFSPVKTIARHQQGSFHLSQFLVLGKFQGQKIYH